MRELKINDFFIVIKEEIRLIIITTLLGTLIASIVTFFVLNPKYEATVKVFVGKEKFKSTSQNYSNDEVTMYQRILKTYSEVIKTKDTMETVIKKAKEDVAVLKALNNLSVTPVADTQILQFVYKSKDKEEAYNMVYALAEEFMETAKVIFPKGNVQVLEHPIIPKSPVSPNKVINISIGAILGLMMGFGIVFLKEYMDNTFKSKEVLESILEIPTLGVIPTIEE